MSPTKCLLISLMVLGSAPAARAAEVRADRVEAALLQALSTMKVKAPIVPASLHFAKAPLLRSFDDASIVVERVTIAQAGSLDARLRCRPVSACLPFHASARLQTDGGSLMARTWTATEPHNETSTGKVKRGEHVVFVSTTNGARTFVQAMTLDDAAVGQPVRVRAIDGKHEVLRGRLCAAHVVRGES